MADSLETQKSQNKKNLVSDAVTNVNIYILTLIKIILLYQ